jgi:hypothetical protein
MAAEAIHASRRTRANRVPAHAIPAARGMWIVRRVPGTGDVRQAVFPKFKNIASNAGATTDSMTVQDRKKEQRI